MMVLLRGDRPHDAATLFAKDEVAVMHCRCSIASWAEEEKSADEQQHDESPDDQYPAPGLQLAMRYNVKLGIFIVNTAPTAYGSLQFARWVLLSERTRVQRICSVMCSGIPLRAGRLPHTLD